MIRRAVTVWLAVLLAVQPMLIAPRAAGAAAAPALGICCHADAAAAAEADRSVGPCCALGAIVAASRAASDCPRCGPGCVCGDDCRCAAPAPLRDAPGPEPMHRAADDRPAVASRPMLAGVLPDASAPPRSATPGRERVLAAPIGARGRAVLSVWRT